MSFRTFIKKKGQIFLKCPKSIYKSKRPQQTVNDEAKCFDVWVNKIAQMIDEQFEWQEETAASEFTDELLNMEVSVSVWH